MNFLRLALVSATLLFPSQLLASVSIACGAREYAFVESPTSPLVELIRSGDVSAPSTANIQILDASGTVRAWSAQYRFEAGETRKTVSYYIHNDLYSGSFSGLLNCYPEGRPDLGDKVPLTYTDDEPYPTLTVPPTLTTWEFQSEYFLYPKFTPAFAFDIPFQATYVSGTATLGSDIAVTAEPIQISTSRGPYLRVGPIVEDQIPEETESFTIEWSGSGFKATTVVTIVDNDPAVRFASTPETIREVDGSYSVNLTWPLNLHLAREAFLEVRPQWREAASVYEIARVTFQPGEASKVVQLKSFNDEWYIGDRKVLLELGIGGLPIESRLINVIEDEIKPVYSILDASVEEITSTDGWYGVLYFPIQFTGGNRLGPARANVRVTSLTAQRDVDFSCPASFNVSAGPNRLRVIVAGDLLPEEDETFEVEITPENPIDFDVARSKAIGTIRDDDRNALPLALDELEYRIPEGTRRIPVRVNRRGDRSTEMHALIRAKNVDPARVVSIEPVPVTMKPGSVSEDVELVIDDDLYSGAYETQLEVVADGVVHDVTAILIEENEPVPTLTLRDIEATEGPGATANFELLVHPPYAYGFTVDATIKDGSATVGEDVRAPIEPYRVAGGTARSWVEIPLIDDQQPEAPESFEVELSFLRPENGVRNFLSATAVIKDDDDSTALFPRSSRVSTGTTFTMTLDRGENVAAETIQIRSSDASVVEAPQQVVVAAGQRLVPISLTTRNRGFAQITVTTGAQTLTATVDVYSVHSIVATPRELVLVAGNETDLVLTLSPPADIDAVVVVSSSNEAVAKITATAVVPATRSSLLRVRALAPGTSTISLTLPRELGGATTTIPIRVVPGTSKRRGSRN